MFGFLTLNWPVLFFVVALIIAIVVTTLVRSFGTLAIALVLYLGISWQLWPYVSLVFWQAFFVGLAVAIWFRFFPDQTTARITRIASRIALAIPLTCLVIRIFGALWQVRDHTGNFIIAALAIALVVFLVWLVFSFKWLIAALAVVTLLVAAVWGNWWDTSPSHSTQQATQLVVAQFSCTIKRATVTCDAGKSAATKGHAIASYKWNFGESSASSKSSPNRVTSKKAIARHTYQKKGTYNVSLTVVETVSGLVATKSHEISIKSVPAAAAASACKTWKMTSTTPSNGNWVAKGITEIQTAKTQAQAQKAALVWLNELKVYPGEINGASIYLLGKSISTSSLVKNGCATQAAVNRVQELKTYIELHPAKVSQAPSNASNSGTKKGVVLTSSKAGIKGNRKAVAIKSASGKVVYVMGRCGNAVTTHAAKKTAKKVVKKATKKVTKKTATTHAKTKAKAKPTHKAKAKPTPTCKSGQVGTYPNCHAPKPQSPTIVDLTTINDVPAGGTSGNFCVTVNLPGSDKGTVTFSAHYGSFTQSSYSASGEEKHCSTYVGPDDPTSGSLRETVKVFLRDNTTGLSTSRSETFTVNKGAQGGRP